MTNSYANISRCMFLDFETIETDRQRVVDYLDANLRHPKSMTKAETIDAWRVEKRPEALAEVVADTALDGGLGRLASIAFAIGDGPVLSVTSARAASGDVPAGFDADLERKLIVRFYAAFQRYCDENGGRAPTLVGHNIVGYDIRWIWKRGIVLGIQPPPLWPIDAKPWEAARVFDTMTVWEGHGGRISLDRLAISLDLPTKTGFDGSMVGHAWKAGDFETIRRYNATDVETVRSIWKRITGYQTPAVETAQEPASSAAEATSTQPTETPPAPASEVDNIAPQTPDRPVRISGLGFCPGIRATVQAEGSAHTTGASA